MIKKYEGWMLSKTTIHHGGDEKTGSSPILRTIMMYLDGIGEVAMPYINGNAIRGKLRRQLMRDYFMRLDVIPEELNPKIFHIFFSGGALESNEGNTGVIDLELRRRIRSTIIPLSLLGTAVGNQIIQGKLKVGHAFPICREYKNFLPDFLKSDPRAEHSVREFCDESFHTRRDELKADRAEDEQAVQMKVNFECFIPGTKFFHWFVVEYPTELELSVFGHLIYLFQQSPYIGGMSSTGNGEVVFEYQPQDFSNNLYVQHLGENRTQILELIKELEERV